MRMTKTFASITAMALMAGTAFAQDATTETEVDTDAQVQAGETTAEGGATLTTEGAVEGGDSLQAEGDAATDLNADESMQAEGEADTDLNADAPMQAEGEVAPEVQTDDTLQAETDAAPVDGIDPSKLTTEELAGKPVYSTDDERVGEISELVIDTDGEITDVVIEVGGFLGLGEKPVAVKFGDLRFETEAAAEGEADTMAATDGEADADLTGVVDASAYRIIVPMTEEELEQLPEFED